jgi:formiminoglutamate deiminase
MVAPSSGYWCEWAWVDGAVRPGVAVGVGEDGRISEIEVGVTSPRQASPLRGVVVPGFANAHSHAFHRALRGRTHDGPGSFWTWRDLMYRVANRLDPDSYHRLARSVFGEMVLAGITSVGEFHYVHHRPDGARYDDPNAMGVALLSAADDVGIRITLLDALYLHGGLDSERGLQPIGEEQRRFSDGSFDAWAERVEALMAIDTRHRIGVAIHSVRAVAPDDIARVADVARRHRVPLHVHGSEQLGEVDACRARYGVPPLELLCDHGVGPGATIVHGTHVDADEIGRVAASGATVCFCPTTERDLGDGLGPARDYRAAGVRLSLGTDSHAEIDLLAEARALELDERLRLQERGVFSAAQLLACATDHRSLGWEDAGAIVVGRRADLVAVDVGSVRLAGTPRELAGVLFAASASDVTDVVVDGRHVVRGGTHRDLDVAAELDAAIREVLG